MAKLRYRKSPDGTVTFTMPAVMTKDKTARKVRIVPENISKEGNQIDARAKLKEAMLGQPNIQAVASKEGSD